MYRVTYGKYTLEFDEKSGQVLVNGNKSDGTFQPAYAPNEENEKPTFIGYFDNYNSKFISLSGNVLNSFTVNDVTL